MLNFENLEFESMNMLLVDQLKGGMEAAFLPHFQEFGKHLHQEEELSMVTLFEVEYFHGSKKLCVSRSDLNQLYLDCREHQYYVCHTLEKLC